MNALKRWIARHGLLDVAGLITWAAVSAAVLPATARDDGTARGVLTATLLVVFIAGFFALPRGARTHRRARLIAGMVLMSASGFGLMIAGPHHSTPILFIILAGAAAYHLQMRQILALLLLLTLGQALILTIDWPADSVLTLITYVAFQAFSAAASYAVRTAEERAVELRGINAELLAAHALLEQTARDTERLRVSRELHDVSGHKLTALKLNLTLLARDSQLGGRKELGTALQLADELLHEVREVVTHLRRHDGLDLHEALHRLTQQVPSPSIHLDIAADAKVSNAEQAVTLLRIAQEAITNAVRHANARNIWLALNSLDGRLDLKLEDDGQVRWPLRHGSGLLGMQERANAMGGIVAMSRNDHGGLTILVSLPKDQPA